MHNKTIDVFWKSLIMFMLMITPTLAQRLTTTTPCVVVEPIFKKCFSENASGHDIRHMKDCKNLYVFLYKILLDIDRTHAKRDQIFLDHHGLVDFVANAALALCGDSDVPQQTLSGVATAAYQYMRANPNACREMLGSDAASCR